MPGRYPHVWVTPAFSFLDFTTKQGICCAIAGYFFSDDLDAAIVVLKDNQTGKTVGTYHAKWGLDME